MLGGLIGEAEGEAGAVGDAVQDAGVGVGFFDLVEGFLEGLFAGAVEFVFPADDFGVWKPGAEHGEDFDGGDEGEGEFVLAARGDFGGGGGIFDFEIAEGGGVEDGGDVFFFEGFEFGGEVVVGGEADGFMDVEGGGIGGLFAFEAVHGVAGGGEMVGESDAEAAGGEIGEAADLVDGFVAGAAGDDDGFQSI